MQVKAVIPPTVSEIMNLTQREFDQMDQLQLASSETLKDKNSLFTGYAVKVHSLTEVRRAFCRIKLFHPEADHIISAYIARDSTNRHDDREFGARLRLQQMLFSRNDTNIVLFVAHSFGGQMLGPKQFLHIENVAKGALNRLHSLERDLRGGSPTSPTED